MATQTTNFRLDKPTVAGDADVWGGFLNNNTIDKIDGFLAKSDLIRNLPTVGATITCDLSLSRVFKFTTTGAHTIAFSNWPTIDPTNPFVRVFMVIDNGGLGALTFDSGVVWDEANKPIFVSSGTDVIELVAIAPTSASSTWWARRIYTSGQKSFPRVVVTHSAAQTIAGDANTALAMDTETLDTHAMHDTVTNNSRLTVPTGQAGAYKLYGMITTENDAVVVTVGIRKNGSTILKTTQSSSEVINQGGGAMVVAYDPAAIVGDYYELIVDNFGNTNDYTVEHTVSGNPTGSALLFAAERIA